MITTEMMFKCVTIPLVIAAVVAAVEQECENCDCCVDGVCAPKLIQDYIVVDYCTHGCIDGMGGNICHNKCPGDCITCEQHTYNNCLTCKAGKYVQMYALGNTSKRCVDCPSECKTCTSLTSCQECKAPYYNSDSAGNCSSTCPSGCKSCTSARQCQECIPPYYNDGNVTDCSLACPSTCKNKTCNKYTGQCFSCETGLYGVICQNNCSEGCKNGECDFETGLCLECAPSYSGNKCCLQNGFCKNCLSNTLCEMCIDGYYGDKCNKVCPALCKLVAGTTQCERTNGSCAACSDGFHGELCTSVCSSFCSNNRCNKDNGHCTDGCVDGYEGPTCKNALTVSNLSVIGISVGISSAVIVVMITITIVISVIILRKRFRKHVIKQQKYQEQTSM